MLSRDRKYSKITKHQKGGDHHRRVGTVGRETARTHRGEEAREITGNALEGPGFCKAVRPGASSKTESPLKQRFGNRLICARNC